MIYEEKATGNMKKMRQIKYTGKHGDTAGNQRSGRGS